MKDISRDSREVETKPHTTFTHRMQGSKRVWASLVAQRVKDPPAMQETLVQSPGWEDPLEKG